jgi:hypothetical protein
MSANVGNSMVMVPQIYLKLLMRGSPGGDFQTHQLMDGQFRSIYKSTFPQRFKASTDVAAVH